MQQSSILKLPHLIALAVVFCASSFPLSATEINLSSRASVSLSSYEFRQSARPGALARPAGSTLPTINGGDFPEVAFAVTFKLLGIGGTLYKGGYYLDLFMQKSLQEDDSFTMTDPGLDDGSNNGIFTETFTVTVKT